MAIVAKSIKPCFRPIISHLESFPVVQQTTINPRLIHITPIASRAEEEDFAWFQESVQFLVFPCKFADSAILDDDIHSHDSLR